MSRETTPAINRVLNRIEPLPWSGCWIFTGALNEFGYGIVGRGGRGQGNDRAHRITYSHFVGKIPDGMFVCHHCDVPSCCNPDHLFLGFALDNTRDCWKKGRGVSPPENPHVVGEVHPLAKLTADKVIEMRRLRKEGKSLNTLASMFGVHSVTVLKITRRERWKHI